MPAIHSQSIGHGRPAHGLYLPLRHPIIVPDGGRVEAHFWRLVSKQKIWYEWALAQPHASPIHNPNGFACRF